MLYLFLRIKRINSKTRRTILLYTVQMIPKHCFYNRYEDPEKWKNRVVESVEERNEERKEVRL